VLYGGVLLSSLVEKETIVEPLPTWTTYIYIIRAINNHLHNYCTSSTTSTINTTATHHHPHIHHNYQHRHLHQRLHIHLLNHQQQQPLHHVSRPTDDMRRGYVFVRLTIVFSQRRLVLLYQCLCYRRATILKLKLIVKLGSTYFL